MANTTKDRKRESKWYMILVRDTDEGGLDQWIDCGEGPFESRELAIRFANSECGLPWLVVLIDAANNGNTVSEIASRNVVIAKGAKK